MGYSLPILVGCIAVTFLSCGENLRQTQEAAKALSTMAEHAPKMEALQKQIEQRQAERRAKGDTTAMHYEKLLEYIPSSVNGFSSVGEPEGSTSTMGDFSLSTAKRTYQGSDGAELTIELVDYNANAAALALAGMGVFLNLSVDNPEERSRTFDPQLPTSGAWESLKKRSHIAEVTYVLGGRFLLHITATKQESTDRVKAIAQQLNLRALASM